MSYCGSTYNTPYGLGSCYGGVTSSSLLPSYGPGSLSGLGGWSGPGTLSGGWSGLGTMSGANIGCSGQLPGSEVVIQPPPSVLTIPGPILTSASEPAAIAQNTPCATGYSGLGSQSLSPLYGGALGGYGRLGYGGWRRYGQRFSGLGYGACEPYSSC